MLVVHRDTGQLEHRYFRDIIEYIAGGDTVVVNATRVFRARLLGTRTRRGASHGEPQEAPAEVFLLRQIDANRFEAMVHPGGKLHPGRRVRIADDLEVVVEEMTDRRTRLVRLETSGDVWEMIERLGHVPLPPYIERSDMEDDESNYQTVFARERGSVAAPTAGLHFSDAVLEQLRSGGVNIAEVVLHVGAGTFKPVQAEDPTLHVMHEERYWIEDKAARQISDAKRTGHKVWAVGSTALRTLESSALAHGAVSAGSGETNLFVRPPYDFKVVDRLLTNFHLPRSTLLMLVAAFAGYELTMKAYRAAVGQRYRFYSYGDAMLII